MAPRRWASISHRFRDLVHAPSLSHRRAHVRGRSRPIFSLGFGGHLQGWGRLHAPPPQPPHPHPRVAKGPRVSGPRPAENTLSRKWLFCDATYARVEKPNAPLSGQRERQTCETAPIDRSGPRTVARRSTISRRLADRIWGSPIGGAGSGISIGVLTGRSNRDSGERALDRRSRSPPRIKIDSANPARAESPRIRPRPISARRASGFVRFRVFEAP